MSESGRLRQGTGGPREAPQRANVAYALLVVSGPSAVT